MEDLQNERIEATNAETVDNNSYIEAINEMKKNSVDKSKYEQLQEENKRLLNSLINGDPYDNKSEEVIPERIEVYKKFKENNFKSDLDYWKNFLDLRKATINEYGKDPCVTGNYGLDKYGNHVEAQYGEAEMITEQLDLMQSIVDESGNDPYKFELLLKQASRK